MLLERLYLQAENSLSGGSDVGLAFSCDTQPLSGKKSKASRVPAAVSSDQGSLRRPQRVPLCPGHQGPTMHPSTLVQPMMLPESTE